MSCTRCENLVYLINTLYEAIAHGDEEHREWLRGKLIEHFNTALQPECVNCNHYKGEIG